MTKTTTGEVIHRVVWPMVQILGHIPFSGTHVRERTLRHGDTVPEWVPTPELDRLQSIGAIEACV